MVDYDRAVGKLCQIGDKKEQLTLIYQWVKQGVLSKGTFLMLFKDYIAEK